MTNDLGVHPPRCPSDELLAAYLAETVPSATVVELEAHLRGCDDCTETLVAAQRRIVMGQQSLLDVPPAIRAASALPQAHDHASAARAASDRARRAPTRPRAWRTRPVLTALIPTALAALAILVVGQQGWVFPTRPAERGRSMAVRDVLPITAAQAPVYERPGAATATATLTRGTRVEVVGDEGAWFRVRLADGREGWMERSAFE